MSTAARAQSALLWDQPWPSRAKPRAGSRAPLPGRLQVRRPRVGPASQLPDPGHRAAGRGAAQGREGVGLRRGARGRWTPRAHGRPGPVLTPRPCVLASPGLKRENTPGPSQVLGGEKWGDRSLFRLCYHWGGKPRFQGWKPPVAAGRGPPRGAARKHSNSRAAVLAFSKMMLLKNILELNTPDKAAPFFPF